MHESFLVLEIINMKYIIPLRIWKSIIFMFIRKNRMELHKL